MSLYHLEFVHHIVVLVRNGNGRITCFDPRRVQPCFFTHCAILVYMILNGKGSSGYVCFAASVCSSRVVEDTESEFNSGASGSPGLLIMHFVLTCWLLLCTTCQHRRPCLVAAVVDHIILYKEIYSMSCCCC